jgi:hypothetical protein
LGDKLKGEIQKIDKNIELQKIEQRCGVPS